MSMDLFEAIHTRRSVRKFEDKPVGDDTVEQLLAAAMQAPSAGNAQPWHFVVVTDREILDSIPAFSPYAAMAKHAQVGVLICADLSQEKYAGYWVQDCSAAMQNLLLAAHALGLGAVWTGIHPMADREEGFRKLLHLPENVRSLGFVVLGWPAQFPPPERRFKPERIHKNGW